MAELWPRNIVPIDDEKIRLLSSEGALVLYLTALDDPVAPSDLARVTRLAPAAAQRVADELLASGLLTLSEGRYGAGVRHVREDDFSAPGRVAFRLALASVAQNAIDDSRAAVRDRPTDTKVGISMVTLADDPDVLSRAISIVVQAEDELRALQEEHPARPGEPRLRVVMFTGSAQPLTKTPQ